MSAHVGRDFPRRPSIGSAPRMPHPAQSANTSRTKVAREGEPSTVSWAREG